MLTYSPCKHIQVKYRKHKKNNKTVNGVSTSTAALGVKTAIESGHVKPAQPNGMMQRKSPVIVEQQPHHQQQHGMNGLTNGHHNGAPAVPRIANGNILKTALTNPSEVLHLRRRLDTTVSSSRDSVSGMPYETAMSNICTLIYCDEFEDIATLKVKLEIISFSNTQHCNSSF